MNTKERDDKILDVLGEYKELSQGEALRVIAALLTVITDQLLSLEAGLNEVYQAIPREPFSVER